MRGDHEEHCEAISFRWRLLRRGVYPERVEGLLAMIVTS